VTLSVFLLDLWCQKTRVPGIPYGTVCMFLHLAILAQCRLLAVI